MAEPRCWLGARTVAIRRRVGVGRRQIATIGMEELGHTYRTAVEQVASLLAVVHLRLQSSPSGGVSLAQRRAVHALTCAYLALLLALLDEAGTAIGRGVAQQGELREIGAAQRRRIEQLAAGYLDEVQALLRR